MNLILATILAVLCSATAKAGLITQTDTIAGGGDFTFLRFDTSLGTLNQVSFDFSGTVASDMTLTNTSTTPGTLSEVLAVHDSVTIPLSGGGFLILTSTAAPTTLTVNLPPGAGPITIDVTNPGNAVAVNLLAPLASFEGTAGSTITFATTDASTIDITISGLGGTITAQDTETMTLGYQYTAGATAVPEPSSVFLTATMLLGLAFVAGKRIVRRL